MPKRALAAVTLAASGTPAWYERLYSGAMSPEYKQYMATEWGWEKRGDRPLFEKLSLEGAQAGLSWATILAKREGYRTAFHKFDIDKCAAMSSADVNRLLSAESASIVRHPGKVESIINNARCIQQLIRDAEASGTPTPPHGHFDALLWSYVGGSPTLNTRASEEAIPSESEAATAMCVRAVCSNVTVALRSVPIRCAHAALRLALARIAACTIRTMQPPPDLPPAVPARPANPHLTTQVEGSEEARLQIRGPKVLLLADAVVWPHHRPPEGYTGVGGREAALGGRRRRSGQRNGCAAGAAAAGECSCHQQEE